MPHVGRAVSDRSKSPKERLAAWVLSVDAHGDAERTTGRRIRFAWLTDPTRRRVARHTSGFEGPARIGTQGCPRIRWCVGSVSGRGVPIRPPAEVWRGHDRYRRVGGRGRRRLPRVRIRGGGAYRCWLRSPPCSRVLTDPGTPSENVVAVAAVVPFVLWAWRPAAVPTLALVVVVVAAQFPAQRSGDLEPLLFLVAIAAGVVGSWEPSRWAAVVAGTMAAATPFLVEVVVDDDILYRVWTLGVLLFLLLGWVSRWQLRVGGRSGRGASGARPPGGRRGEAADCPRCPRSGRPRPGGDTAARHRRAPRAVPRPRPGGPGVGRRRGGRASAACRSCAAPFTGSRSPGATGR